MRQACMILVVVASCSIPSPKAPTWEVTGNVPLVARTVFVRDLIGAQGDFFFGEYGPFRLMDADSVAASVVSEVIVAEPFALQGLPADGETTVVAGTVSWNGNPMDELDNPSFYRGWLEIVVRHNLPGSALIHAVCDGWDDDRRPCGPIEATVAVDPSPTGREVTSTHIISNPQILEFINQSATHAVPDSYAVRASLTYTGLGTPVGPDPSLSIEISLLTAFDLTFDGATVDRRSIVQSLTIGPEGTDADEADIDGDMTKNLRRGLIVADIANNLPLGGRGFLRVDHDAQRLWEAPELMVGPFVFAAPPTDPVTGRSMDVARVPSLVTLTEEQLSVFANAGSEIDTLYAAVEYVLDGSGTHRICICAEDSLSARVRMEITSLVELDDAS